jgi:hypothetical protein
MKSYPKVKVNIKLPFINRTFPFTVLNWRRLLYADIFVKNKKRMKSIFIISVLLCCQLTHAQVAINQNGAQPNSSSMLDVSAASKGLLIPRMSSSQRAAIADPATGLLVYDVDRQTIYLFDGQAWRPFALAKDNYMTPVERTPEGAHPFNNFGSSVAIYGDYAIVGAPGDTANGVNQGAAYIFHRGPDGWEQQAKLHASNGAAGDQFGASVDIWNDYVAIGAPYKAISNELMRGRVYVFKRNGTTWTQMVGLQASDGKPQDQFGTSVALYNNILVVGAPWRDNGNDENAGAVYPFALVNGSWLSRGVINDPDLNGNHYFGHAVDFWNNTLVAGSSTSVTDGKSCGAVFTYLTNADGSTWINGVKIIPPVNKRQDWMHFGLSVSFNNDTLLIGSPSYDDGTNENTGAAFLFYKQNGVWSSGSLFAGEGAHSEMGVSVALDGNNCFIGHEQWSNQKGRVVVYANGYEEIISNPYPNTPSNFGKKIAIHNGRYIIADDWGKVYFGVWQ